MTNAADRFVNRAKSTIRSFRVGRYDYEATMNLLTEHAHRVGRINHRVVSHAAQAHALSEIYHLIEWVQAKDSAVVTSDQFATMTALGDGNYVTPQRHAEY